MTEFEKKLRAAVGKCLEEDEAMFRSLESQETPILRTKRTERRNTMSTLKKTVKVASLVLVCTSAVTAAVTMSVKAIREKVTSAVVSWFKGYAIVEYEEPDHDSIEKIKIMKPTCVPERYDIITENRNDFGYECGYSDKNGNTLLYEQAAIPAITSVESDNGCKESTITLDGGQEAELFTYDSGRYILIWYDGKNYFYIRSNGLSYDELMSFVEGLEETEMETNKPEYVPEKEKTVVFPNGDVVKMAYKSQYDDAQGIPLTEYVDEIKGKYTFRNNELLSVCFNSNYWREKHKNDTDFNYERCLDEDEIVSSVETAIRGIFGSRFDGFTLLNCELRNEGSYNIEFGHLIGKEKAVLTGLVIANARNNGDLLTCMLNMTEGIDGFDESRLDGISEDVLLEYADNYINERYIGSENVRLIKSYLKKDGENFVIEILAGFGADAKMTDSEQEISENKKMLEKYGKEKIYYTELMLMPLD